MLVERKKAKNTRSKHRRFIPSFHCTAHVRLLYYSPFSLYYVYVWPYCRRYLLQLFASTPVTYSKLFIYLAAHRKKLTCSFSSSRALHILKKYGDIYIYIYSGRYGVKMELKHWKLVVRICRVAGLLFVSLWKQCLVHILEAPIRIPGSSKSNQKKSSNDET